jgi:hypothetical protein
MPEPIALQLAGQGDATKLAWTGPTWSKTYCVNREMLYNASQDVRGVLQEIAQKYLRPSGSYLLNYPALAHAGEELRVALFTDLQGQYATKLVQHLESQPPGTWLTVFSDASVQVPWNFVLFGDPNELPPPAQALQDFDRFWSGCFKIVTRFSSTEFPPSAVSRSNLRTLLALHASRFASAEELLSRRYPDIHDKIEQLLQFQVGAQDNWDKCRSSWRNISQNDSILYVFAHSDGQKLYLKDEDRIDETDRHRYAISTTGFQTIFAKPRDTHSNSLCFINGCRTADGKLGDGFLSVTSGVGFHGFIGSEAEISSDWATRYAVEFLHGLIIESKPVHEVYNELRARCFPLSLWYSCCAEPNFRVTAD